VTLQQPLITIHAEQQSFSQLLAAVQQLAAEQLNSWWLTVLLVQQERDP
jgi:hypothetical protein